MRSLIALLTLCPLLSYGHTTAETGVVSQMTSTLVNTSSPISAGSPSEFEQMLMVLFCVVGVLSFIGKAMEKPARAHASWRATLSGSRGRLSSLDHSDDVVRSVPVPAFYADAETSSESAASKSGSLAESDVFDFGRAAFRASETGMNHEFAGVSFHTAPMARG